METVAGSGSSVNAQTRVAARDAVHQARSALAGHLPAFGLLFISPSQDPRVAHQTAVAELAVPWLACTTAGEITERGATHGGVTAFLVASDDLAFKVGSTRSLAREDQAGSELSAGLEAFAASARQKGFGYASAILFADGLSPMLEPLVAGLRKRVPFPQQLVGGGAGDETNLKDTRVLVDGEPLRGAAQMLHVFGRKPWGIGVGHGLKPVGRPLVATRVTGNVVEELDGRPAIEAYRDFAREQGLPVESVTTPGFLITHELGVMMLDNLYKVRAPLGVTPTGGLVCAGSVDAGARVSIVKAEPRAMREAVLSAAREAKTNLQGASAAGLLVFSCVCRGMVLGSAFQAEVDAIREVFPAVPLAGMLSYGEFARYAGKLSGYHNNTVVVAAIPA